MPNWLIESLPLLAIVLVFGFAILCAVAIAFPKDKDGPRGGGMIE
jgi:hypothetical protein